MPEARITLKFKEKKVVWNREVLYQDYKLMEGKALIIAGNESNWMQYLEGIEFTKDFYVMVTSFDLVSVSLYIRYGADTQYKWACGGAPNYICYQGSDGIYNTEAECKAVCKGAPCSPVWKCETPANGFETDGCGMRRANTRCDPIVSVPLSLSADKTTIKVGDLISVSGKYKSGARVIIYEDVLLGKTFAETTCNSAGAYSLMIYLNKPIGTYRIRAKSDALILPDLSNIVTITVIEADTPCVPKWVCETPLNGYENDGCGHRGYNSLCLPLDPGMPCADGNTRTILCPDDPSKSIGQVCSGGKWTDVSSECPGKEFIPGISNEVLILGAVAVIVIFIIIIRRRK